MTDALDLVAALGDLVADGPAPGPGTDSATSVAAFAIGAFRTFENDPRLLDLCVFASTHSVRDQRQWIALRDVVAPQERAALLEAAAASPDLQPTLVAWLGAWVVRRAFGSSVLIALFDDRDGAATGAERVARLAEILKLGFRLRRRSDDARLMSTLAITPTREEWPRGALHNCMSQIAQYMRSDGAKIYLLRRTAAGPCLEIFSRTDVHPGRQPAPYPLSKNRGLADWVIRNGDAILIDDPVEPSRAQVVPERCRTGGGGVVEVFGRPGREQDPGDPTGDRERAFLLVPMRSQDRVIGALSLWRLNDDDYDVDLDLASAEHLAARLAPICQWMVASELRDRVAHEVAKLGAMVADARDPREVYAAVAASAGHLARGARALLLLAHEPETLFATAEWSGDGADARSEATFFRWRGDPVAWTTGIPADVKARIQREHRGYRLRPRPLVVSRGTDASPARGGGVVLVLDRADVEPIVTCDDGVAEDETTSFLQQIGSLVLSSYPKVIAAAVARRLREASPAVAVDRRSTDWVPVVADTIRSATGADAVLLYHRDHGELRVIGTSRGAEALRGLAAVRDSLTGRCFSEQTPVLIADIEDHAGPAAAPLHRGLLKEISARLLWKGIRSWYCQPVAADTHSLGVIKLLTRAGGRFLDPICVDIVTTAAAHIASEMAHHFETAVLDGLNKLAENLSGKEGRALAEAMVGELESWAGRFIQEKCLLVVIASVSMPRLSVFTASGSIDVKSFEATNSLKLDALSAMSSDELTEARPVFVLPEALRGFDQIVAPIGLRGNTLLRGWVLVIAKDPVGRQEESVAAEAAREISILLDYEQRTRLRIEQTARLRHALLGPVQGVMNQADLLNRFVKKGRTDPEGLREIAARIRSEANAIGLWRDIQRLYATTNVRVVTRTQALRPIVERCVDRFREPIRVERSGSLHLEFRPGGSLDIPLDEPAIDLVLTNLLDNARKYSFAHTAVHVTVESLGAMVKIVVEDVGHGIPRRLEERIYQVGARLDWDDRIRSIDGTGLGLPISRAIVVAHSGRLYHECDEGISVSDPNRCRVRFIIELPSRWRV